MIARKIIYNTVDTSFDFEGSIEEVIERLQARKAMYPDKELHFTKDGDYEETWYTLQYVDRETDEDYKKRVDAEAAAKRAAARMRTKQQQDKEFQEYQRLKSKFEQ